MKQLVSVSGFLLYNFVVFCFGTAILPPVGHLYSFGGFFHKVEDFCSCQKFLISGKNSMKAIIKPHKTLVISWRPAGIRFEMSPPHIQQFEITYIPRKFVQHI